MAKRIGYWSWKESQASDQPLLPLPDTDMYHPAKHYDLPGLAKQADKQLEHAVHSVSGDGYYDKKRMDEQAIQEIADCSMRQFCTQMGVAPYPEQWPPEIQQAWAIYTTAAATEVTHRQNKLKPMGREKRTEALETIARKHGKHARKTTGW